MKILRLSAENFKRLSAVTITPDGAVCQITGRNGAGKSSVLDAIQAALGGARCAPDRPIRTGASAAKIRLETEKFVITRKWTAKSDTLTVESKDGARYRSPQAMLDDLVGNLSFDPLAFSRLPAKEQAQMLRDVIGLDTTGIDDERRKVYDRRTEINSDVRHLESRLNAVTVPEDPGEVGEEIDLAEIAEQKAQVERVRGANVRARLEATQAQQEYAAREKRVRDLEEELGRARAAAREARRLADEATARVDNLRDPDVSEIDAQLTRARDHNAEVKLRQRHADARDSAVRTRDELSQQLEAKQLEADALTQKLKDIDASKARLLSEAKFPIPGMSIEGDTVILNDVPFRQASSAEQLRAGLAMGAKLNPELRVVLVRDGSLLDEDGLRLVAEWAAENDMQCWLERVATGNSVGIVIEDGHVAGVDQAEATP